MSTAEVRDIIADGVFSHLPIDGTTPLYRAVDAILAALTAAGWTLAPPGSRVVPEGGVDRETVMKCIALIEQSWKPVGAGDGQTFVVGCGGGTAALRALAEAKP